MNGVDYLLARGGLDQNRLAITGGSYGGYMTTWTVGHTDRFACAVSINPVTDLVSFYGTSDIGAIWFERQMGGPLWERWDLYTERSPIRYVAHVDTPLLLIHAENDHRCPIEQSEQMFTALKMRGCEVELVRIPGSSHALATAPGVRHRLERWRLACEWFHRYLKAEG
jgi:acylaminoacyl-peptidase